MVTIITNSNSEPAEVRRERSSTGVVVAVVTLLLLILFLLFGRGAFVGGNRAAPATSTPGPTGTSTQNIPGGAAAR